MEAIQTVLKVHNYYQQPGGEDQDFIDEGDILQAHGHRVLRYIDDNDRIQDLEPLTLVRGTSLAGTTVWSKRAYRELRKLFRAERPQVVHFHNTFPLISPSAYYAAKAEGVAVVQTLHNYRIFCINGMCYRDGHACEDCLGKVVPWPGVLHSCYRSDRAASGVAATMLTAHRALGTWTKMVDMYIAVSEFTRKKMVEGGHVPAEKLVAKPNFVHPDPGPGEGRGGYALFVGRFAPEKGLDTLLTAWERLKGKLPLKLVGAGPLAPRVAADAARRGSRLEWLGRQPLTEVLKLMGEASFLVFPTNGYESFGRVAVEAFAKGTPVIASKLGAIGDLIDHGRTGLYFRAGDPKDLAEQVEWALSHPTELARMRQEARAEYEAKYDAEGNYQMLMEIYQQAIQRARADAEVRARKSTAEAGTGVGR